MGETWRPIPNWEGYYEVSEQGRIRSVDRTVTDRNGVDYRLKGVMMTTWTNENGYQYVNGSRHNRIKGIWIHRAVLEAFVSPRPSGMVGMHLNNDPSDNRPENLRWGTQKENLQQMISEGRQANMRKTHCPRGHVLSDPNLNKNIQRQGRRACQACYRATQDYPLGKHGEAVVKSVSDKNYERIMAQVSAAA